MSGREVVQKSNSNLTLPFYSLFYCPNSGIHLVNSNCNDFLTGSCLGLLDSLSKAQHGLENFCSKAFMTPFMLVFDNLPSIFQSYLPVNHKCSTLTLLTFGAR